MRKRLLALLMSAVMMAALLSGCGGKEPAPDTQTPDAPPATESTETVEKTVIVGFDQEPETLDASTSTAEVTRGTTDMIFGRLVDRDESGTVVVPAVAESWEYVSDTEIEFKLRKDVVFHNGRPLVADDIVFSIEKMLDENYGGAIYAKLSRYVTGVEAVDDYTVRMTMSEPFAGVLMLLTGMPILCEEAMDTLATAPVSCGPFKFVSWDKNQNMKLEAFEDYYEEGVPSYKNLQFNFYAEENTCLTAFLAGDVDIIYWASNVNIPTLKASGNCEVISAPASQFYFQGNMTKAPFNVPGVMKALSLAVDRDEIVDLVLDGYGEPAYIPAASNDPMHPDDIAYETNLTEAKRLLAEAGYPNGFSCTLLAPKTAVEGVMAEVLQAQLARIGVNVELQVPEVAAFLEQWAEGDFDLAICGHGIPSDAAVMAMSWITGAGGPNNGKWENKEFTDLVLKANVATDEETRKELLYDAYHIFVDEAAVVYCISDQRSTPVRDGITGLIKRFSLNDYSRMTVE